MQLYNLSHTSGQPTRYASFASSVVQNPYYYFCQMQGFVKIRMKKRFHPDPPSRVDCHLNKCLVVFFLSVRRGVTAETSFSCHLFSFL